MRNQTFSMFGKTSGQGVLLVPHSDDMKRFFKQHPNQTVMIEFTVVQEKTSGSLRAYYEKKIVPDFQNLYREVDGEYLSLSDVDKKLRSSAPMMMVEIPKEETGGYELVRVLGIYECSMSTMVQFIDYLRMMASIEYDHFIDDPRKI